MGAKPLAFEEATPQASLPVRYEGNSMLIRLSGSAGTIAVSVGPSDGWWYRLDGGAWKQSGYKDYRMQVAVGPGNRELEVRYFDPRLRKRRSHLVDYQLFLSLWVLADAWGQGTGSVERK